MASLALVASNPPEEMWEGWSRFVPRLSMRDHSLLGELPAGALAKPLLQARLDAQLVFAAHREPAHLVVLEPEAWRNQRRRSERHPEFNAMGSQVSLPSKLDPAGLRSAQAAALVRYVEGFLLLEETRGADALVLPSHMAGGHGQAARDGELRLSEAGVELAQRGGYAERGLRRKPVLVGITLDAKALVSLAAAVALARSYSNLGGDGYWVQLASLTEATTPVLVSRAATFLIALEELSGRRVFAVDCKNLTWPLLAAGLWGACIGVGEREQFDGPAAPSRKRRSIKPTVVHQPLLRNFQVGSRNGTDAFRALPCECGVHPPALMPTRKPDIRRHALRIRNEMADGASSAQAVRVVRRWLFDAEWAAGELELEQPATAAYNAVLNAIGWRSAASG